MAELKEYKFIGDLDGSFFMGYVRARVLQKYVVPEGGADMILIDQKGATINAKIAKKNITKFTGDLEEGKIYDIGKFGVATADRSNRPTRHRKMMWINSDTKTELIEEITNFPDQRRMIFTPLKNAVKLLETGDSTFLHDLIGVVTSWTNEVHYDTNKVKREVMIQDQTGATVKVTLWNKYAHDFAHLGISDKSVFIVSSTSLNQFAGRSPDGFTTSRFSEIFVDMECPQTNELKKSDNYEPVKAGIKLTDWRENEKTTLAHIFRHFTPDKTADRYTCVGKLGHEETILYKACKECNSKSPDGEDSFYCHRCSATVSTHVYCRSRVTFNDTTSTEGMTLFGNHLETVLKVKVSDVVEAYNNKTLYKLFTAIKEKLFVLQLKPTVVGSTMFLSVVKVGKFIDVPKETVDYDVDPDCSEETESNTGLTDKTAEDDLTLGKEIASPTTPGKSNSFKRNNVQKESTTRQRNQRGKQNSAGFGETDHDTDDTGADEPLQKLSPTTPAKSNPLKRNSVEQDAGDKQKNQRVKHG